MLLLFGSSGVLATAGGGLIRREPALLSRRGGMVRSLRPTSLLQLSFSLPDEFQLLLLLLVSLLLKHQPLLH